MKIPPVNVHPTDSSTTAGTRRSEAAPQHGVREAPGAQGADKGGHGHGRVSGDGVDIGAFDGARVSAIKQAITEGRMSVDPSVVADRLIAQALDLAGKGRA